MVPRHAQDRLLSAPEFLRGAPQDRGKDGAREQALSPPHSLSLRVDAADQVGPAVEHRQRLVGRLRRQGDDYPSGAHIAVALQQIGILGAAEQRSSRRPRAGGLRSEARQEPDWCFSKTLRPNSTVGVSVPRQSTAIGGRGSHDRHQGTHNGPGKKKKTKLVILQPATGDDIGPSV